jgi:hypothetical protein
MTNKTGEQNQPKTFKVPHAINFKNNKFTLYECDKEHLSGKKYYYICQGVNVFCWLNLLKNVYRFRIFRTILWMPFTLLSHLAASSFKEHYNQFVSKIDLLDDGRTTEVTYLTGSVLKVPITQFE